MSSRKQLSSYSRRGKRGGRRHRSKLVLPAKLPSLTAEEKCASALTMESVKWHNSNQTSLPGHNLQAPEAILQHWSPQCRPNTLLSSPISVLPAVHVDPKPGSISETCLARTSRTLSHPDRFKIERKDSRFFPLSAFLACPDSIGRCPSTSKFLNSTTVESPSSSASPSTDKTNSSEAIAASPSTIPSRSCALPFSTPMWSAPASPSHDSDLQLASFAKRDLMHSLQKSSKQLDAADYRATPDAGASGCKRTCTALITAPIGSSRPFINMVSLQVRPAIPKEIFDPKVTLTPAMPLKSKLTLHPTRLERQHDTRNFLDLGHANPCWCRTRADSIASKNNECAAVEELPTPFAKVDVAGDTIVASSSGAPLDCASLASSLQALPPLCETSTILSEDWIILPHSSHGHGRRSRSLSLCESLEGDGGMYLVSPASYAISRRPTPTPSPEDGMSESDSGNSLAGPCVPSPAESCIEFIRSPWDEEERQTCQRYMCVCNSASTSAVEWPILQDETGFKKTRHALRGGHLSQEDTGRIWEQEWDWFV
ncbi:predicted protein [Plenodomus lingam JN3]|uniref:Predicted protein n=1 Tax=Leptosphaeria maculans (strain JN3 / isolate v23.1.3 / race Av1-4-5-6-7-8) TaxID=985895 RepID=E5A8T5_LEPMJ|nr:predicted protein [Plenodomus lingam JN3]CBY00030.1 predicted protein [Plenodomus lingam JN3]